MPPTLRNKYLVRVLAGDSSDLVPAEAVHNLVSPNFSLVAVFQHREVVNSFYVHDLRISCRRDLHQNRRRRRRRRRHENVHGRDQTTRVTGHSCFIERQQICRDLPKGMNLNRFGPQPTGRPGPRSKQNSTGRSGKPSFDLRYLRSQPSNKLGGTHGKGSSKETAWGATQRSL